MTDYRVELRRIIAFNGGWQEQKEYDHMSAETAQEVADQMRKDWPKQDGWYVSKICMVVHDWD